MNHINILSQKAWSMIAPVWPLQNFIAINPLSGFESMNFLQAIEKNQQYQLFSHAIKEELSQLNQHTIKWCQAFFDEGQASLFMPCREQGFYSAWKNLVVFDKTLHKKDKHKLHYLQNLPNLPEEAILLSLQFMNISTENYLAVLQLLLMTLKGWAGYIKYQAEWSPEKNSFLEIDYLAVRLVLSALLCSKVNHWPKKYEEQPVESISKTVNLIHQYEKHFRKNLLTALQYHLGSHHEKTEDKKKIQTVFCIDVRSEPFRKALEQQKNYETFGFAGFFAAPVTLQQYIKSKPEHACPVLISPTKLVTECAYSDEDEKDDQRRKRHIQGVKNLYYSLKYNVATPCGLAETMGLWMGLWMSVQTFFPLFSQKIKKKLLAWFRPPIRTALLLDEINIETKLVWSETLLNMLNLSNQLAPIVILCGHGSTTVNNAYASALDCGACGANKGGYNAYLMALILNEKEVREKLKNRGFIIPEHTYFIGAEHNTTTDETVFFNLQEPMISQQLIIQIRKDFLAAKKINTAWRHEQMQSVKSVKYHDVILEKRSADWAQTRPEWGLARNAAFIVAPRELTKSIALEGKAFLHSYDSEHDSNGEYLNTIMTAPMIVAQWINHQYLFSTLDNNAYGSGSKVTHNITGKIGVMQGNASDLMSGLPLQSVYKNDNELYHEPQRLMVIIYAPKDRIANIIQKNKQLANLFFNDWVALYAIEPAERSLYELSAESQHAIFWRKCYA